MSRRPLLLVVLALSAVACGPTPPQAPLHYAKQLDGATSGISSACGEASQVSAFQHGDRRALITLEITASSSARKLASVYHRNPSWIYQGETVAQIVNDSGSMLGSCGLHQAQQALQRAAHGS